MNRLLYLAVAVVVAAAYAALWLCAPRPQHEMVRATETGLSSAERHRIATFWSVYRQATAEKKAGQWDAAVREYRMALDLDPSHWDALYYLGNCLVELKRYPEAQRAYTRLAASDNVAARAHSALGALYSRPDAGQLFDLRKAAREYELAQHANADESGSVLRLGEVALAAGDLNTASEYLNAAGRTNFKSVNAAFLLGYVAWSKGDTKQAISQFRAAAALTKAQKPPAGVLGEGDTKLAGHQAMTLPGQRGLFDGFVGKLWSNRDAAPGRMDSLYAEVKSYLASIKGVGTLASRRE